MKNFAKLLLSVLAICLLLAPTAAEAKKAEETPSPAWVSSLAAAKNAKQLFVVAGVGRSTAWISMHSKSKDGTWRQIMTTPGFIGLNGLGKQKEGDGKTPIGVYTFNKAFGLAPDPGCTIPYVQADKNTYWSGDTRPKMKYNQMVDIRDLPNLDVQNSEHIADYPVNYRYCLNISYNDSGIPGLGSAIFVHCFDSNKPFTGGCVALPERKMRFVMENVRRDCVVVINSLENFGGDF